MQIHFHFHAFWYRERPWNAKQPKWFGTKKNTYIQWVCLRASVNKLQIHYKFPHLHILVLSHKHIKTQWMKKKRSHSSEQCIQMCIFSAYIHTQRAMCIKIPYHLSKFSSPLILSVLGTFWLFCRWLFFSHH